MANGTLGELLPTGTIRLLTHLVLHPEDAFHFRALKQRTGLGTGSLQRELARLESLELVSRTAAGGKVFYAPIWDHPSWRAIRILLREHADVADVLRDALSGVPGIQAAFIYGSTVRGDTRSDSDIDLFILEQGMPRVAISRATTEAQSLLDRTVDVMSYTPAKFARRLEGGSGFLTNVLAGPKQWLISNQEALPLPEAG
jgi:predicted nucleotidyltransferase